MVQVLRVVLGSVVGQLPSVFDEPQDTRPPVVSSEVFIQTNTFLSLSYAEPTLLHCHLYRFFFFSVSSSSSRPYISNSHVFIDGELCKRLQSDGPLAF